MLKKDYSITKQYKPEYKVREDLKTQKRKSFLKKMILFFSVLFLIIFIIHSLFFSSFFKIQKIVITGLNEREETEAKDIIQNFFNYKRYVLFSEQNIFFLNKTTLKNTLSRRFDLEEVVIKINWPNTLKIDVKKNKPVLIWKTDQKYFAVYKDGVIEKELFDVSVFELPLVSSGTSTDIIIGKKYLNEKQIVAIEKIYLLFHNYFKNQNIDHFEIASLESKDIKLFVKESWYLLFNIDLDFEQSLKIASFVMTEKIKNTKNLQYLDLRVNGRVYYK